MKAFPIIGALAALVLLAACEGGTAPAACVTDWRTTCSGPETNGGDPGPESDPDADAAAGEAA